MNKKLATSALVLAVLTFAAAAEAGWEEGVAAFRAGDLGRAAQEFQRYVDERPDVYQGHYMLGQVLLKQNKNQEALAHLRKAYDLEPGNLGVQMVLGKAYLDNGRYADAASVLGKIDAGGLPSAQRVPLFQMRAKAYEKTGDDRRARGELKLAADAAPNNADLWFAYGAAAFNAGDMQGALSALKKAADLDARDADKQRTYAQALLRQGRTSQGQAKQNAYATAASALGKIGSPTYDDLIAMAGAQLGAKQYDGAVATAQRAASQKATDWLPAFYLGQAYTQKGEFRTAEAKLKEALTKASKPGDKTTIWTQLGFVYEKQKAYDNAIAAYSQAGNAAGVKRAEENKQTAQYNQAVEQEAAEIARLKQEQDKLKEELKALPGAKPPLR